MPVPKGYLETRTEGYEDVATMKYEPLLIIRLVNDNGFYRAYHMNKQQRLSIRLDCSVPLTKILDLLDMSFDMTDKNFWSTGLKVGRMLRIDYRKEDIMDIDQVIREGENLTTEFKSWVRASSMKERINLAVDELIAFSNAKGGTVYMGIEDDGKVTGCTGKWDLQNIIESIYDKTRPPLFIEAKEMNYKDDVIIALSVNNDGVIHTTTDGRCLKRLGKNSKPYYPEEMSHLYTVSQNPDFTNKIIADSTINDINMNEVYNLKSKLQLRDPSSTLPEQDDTAFLKDLDLLREDGGNAKLTVAGLLFVGKEEAISRFLPQAEVIYLHYGVNNIEEYDSRLDLRQPIITILDRLTTLIENENKIQNIQIGLFRLELMDYSKKVFQEALLNALAHRDYSQMGAVYIKHYSDKIVIENPGGFPEGITESNIITHPSSPRNKLVAETLQRLKYVQRTGQGVDIIFKEMLSMGKAFPKYNAFSDAVTLTLMSATENISFVKYIVAEQERQQAILSLPELMIMRYLSENKKIEFSEIQVLTQASDDVIRKSCTHLIKMGMIESIGKGYMLTAKVYESIKSEIEYTRDRVVRYIKAKEMILQYIEKNGYITNSIIQELCGFTKQQARSTIDKMRKEILLVMEGEGRSTKYKSAKL